ncbi:flagellar basal body P-ring formation chaperone FlgA [Novipirellula sp. SH528]|uniref:flagellar basal body P-ring formation chaperone FlgA n=1 Tax=Novipirellula sp. SH528 TaxID=3454466 RepID=UPI003F9F0ED2
MLSLALVAGVSDACAQTGAFVPVRKSRPASSPGTTIDVATNWTFRMKSESVVNSPIVRLGDVVVPLDPNIPGWPRMSRSAVGLVPVSGKAMRVDRQRLTEVILNAEATPRRLYWIGPDTAEVTYVAVAKPAASVAPISGAAIQQANYNQHAGAVQQADGQHVANRIDPAPQRANLDPQFADRLIKWIELAILRNDAALLERYKLSIDRHQPAMQQLELARGIQAADFINGVKPGQCVLRVVSQGLEGSIQTDLIANLEKNPVAIVPIKSIRSGNRLGRADFTERPIPIDEWDDSYCIDVNELVGMETRGNLRNNEPIPRSQVGKPTLIRRGDLVEVRVINGAISVTTNAKSLGDGAESELVEIETLEPRKRLVARVVNSGEVEIVTRAPQAR